MAFKLNKDENQQHQQLIEDLRTTYEKIETLKKADPICITDLRLQIASYGVIVDETEDFRDTVASRLRSEFDDKSEKWQEGDKGSEVNEFITEWEDVTFETPEIPIDVTEFECDDFSETLEGLPTGME